MDAKLIALRLFLDSMGVSASIETVADRKRVQKAVYLAQVAGADLGYRFSWYLMGPYSRSLTEDYYAMNEMSVEIEAAAQGRILHPAYQSILQKVRADIRKPDNVDLTDEQWLELLASYDYLRRVSRLPDKEASEQIAKEKPRLFPWLAHAVEAIQKSERFQILS